MTTFVSRALFGRRRAFLRPLALLLTLVTACAGSDVTAVNEPSDPANEIFASALGVQIDQMTPIAARLYVQDLVVGTGAQAVTGDSISVLYTGWLRTGVKFDGNAPSGNPLLFKLGIGRVILGWDLGVEGMRVGGKRRLVIGSEYAYGAQGFGQVIPPNATLVFDVELISVVN